jgi:hypothetical protein
LPLALARPLLEQHDRGRRAGEQRRLRPSDVTQGARGSEIGDHHGEGAILAVLARPQTGDRRLVRGIHGEVVAADALDGNDRPVAQQAGRPGDRIV